MSYKSDFASNNADLQTILDMVNVLPDKTVKCKITVKQGANNAGFGGRATVTINNTQYANTNPDEKVITVEPGTDIVLYVTYSGSASSKTAIVINGATVASSGKKTYTYTVTSDVVIELSELASGANFYGYISVSASESNGGNTDAAFTPTDSGGTTYKSKFADNNTDLQSMLNKINAL